MLRPRSIHPLFASWKTNPAAKAEGVCEVVVGTVDELTRAAGRGVVATHALFPVLPADGPPLTLADRDRLWELWQVPVYAVMLDAAGRVIAFECETQEGMHLSGWIPAVGTLESSPCECGRPGERWIPVQSHASSAA